MPILIVDISKKKKVDHLRTLGPFLDVLKKVSSGRLYFSQYRFAFKSQMLVGAGDVISDLVHSQ